MEIIEYIEYVKDKHRGQLRKQGTLYYLHPVAVCKILYDKGIRDKNILVASLFHDLIEDTSVTYEDIKEISNQTVVDTVRLLSKEEGYIMEEYIARIRKDDSARLIKLADRVHNLSEASYGTKNFQNKYIKETEKWYVNLAKGTVFEDDLNKELNNLKQLQYNEKNLER